MAERADSGSAPSNSTTLARVSRDTGCRDGRVTRALDAPAFTTAQDYRCSFAQKELHNVTTKISGGAGYESDTTGKSSGYGLSCTVRHGGCDGVA